MITNLTPGNERAHTRRGSFTPADVRNDYRNGKIKLSTAVLKLAKYFEWTLAKAKTYLQEADRD